MAPLTVEPVLCVSGGELQFPVVIRSCNLTEIDGAKFVHVSSRTKLGQKIGWVPEAIEQILKLRSEKISEIVGGRNRLFEEEVKEQAKRQRISHDQKIKIPDVFSINVPGSGDRPSLNMRVASTWKQNGPLHVECTAENLEFLLAPKNNIIQELPSLNEEMPDTDVQDIVDGPKSLSPVQAKTGKISDFFKRYRAE